MEQLARHRVDAVDAKLLGRRGATADTTNRKAAPTAHVPCTGRRRGRRFRPSDRSTQIVKLPRVRDVPVVTLFSTLLLAASTCVLASCSDSAENHLRFLVDVRTDWTIPAASAEELGYSISVEVRPIYQNSKCPDIPSTTRILVNGAAVALSPNTWTACMEAKVQLGPFMQDQTITVNVEEAGNITAEAVYDGLTPGTAATIVPPLSGPLHPGEEIVIRPIPELPSSSGTAVFYPLDSDWHPYGINGTTSRLPDGLHVQSPAFSGNAIVAVWNGDFALPKFTCLGFNTCEGSAATVLGPFFVVGAP